MPISIDCPKCKTHFDLPDKAAGTERRCHKCGGSFKVVGGTATKAAKPAARRDISEGVIQTGEAPAAGGAAKYGIIAAGIAVLGIAGFFIFRKGGTEAPPEDKSTTTHLGTSPDVALLEETKAKIAEARTKAGTIKDPITYGRATDLYRDIVALQSKITNNGMPQGTSFIYPKPTLTEADRLVGEHRLKMEEQFRSYLLTVAERASTLDEALSGHTRPDMPILKEWVMNAVQARKPQLVAGVAADTVLNYFELGRAQETSDAERNAFLRLVEAADPRVKQLYVKGGDEVLKLFTGDAARAAKLDAALAKYFEAAADMEVFDRLAISAVFRSNGAPTVPARMGTEAIKAPELLAVTRRLWKKFGPQLPLHTHVNIVRKIVERGSRESWGDLDVVILGGKEDPAYMADLFTQLVSVVPDQPPAEDGKPRSIPYHRYLKAALPGMTEDHIMTVLTACRDWKEDCLNARLFLAALMETPTSKAIPALLAAYRQPGSLKADDILKAIVKCYNPRDKVTASQVDNVLNEWASADPRVMEILQMFIAEGKLGAVVKLVMNVLESGADSGEKWFKLAGDILAKDADGGLAEYVVPALIHSYVTIRGDSPARKAVLAKYKAPQALIEAVMMYPRMQDPSPEFTALLRSLLDKRAAKFLKWAAFTWSKRPGWAIEELRRVTGDSGPLDVKYWDAYLEKSAAKLGAQIEGFEVVEDKK